MAISRVQYALASLSDTVATGHTAATLPTPATAGNLLIAAWGVDKNAGTMTGPAGWTVLVNQVGSSVSMLVAYKIAAGADAAPRVTWTDSTVDRASSVIAEYAGVNAASPIGPTHLPAYDDTNRTGMTLDPAAATAAGAALAFFAMDSMTTAGSTTDFRPAATGFPWVATAAHATDANVPGTALAEDLTIASGENIAPAFTWTRSDQTAGFLVLLKEGSTNIAPTVNAGPDQSAVEPWELVTLTGVDSDSDGTVASRVWTQTGGFLLTDDFATKDLSKWQWGAGVSVSGGRMVVTTDSNYYGNTTGPLPLNGTAVSAELVQVPVGPGFVDVYLGLLGAGADSNQSVSLDIESGTMKLYTNYGSGYALLASQAYSTVNHRFIRYRPGRLVAVDTSADGITWTQWQSFTWTGPPLAVFSLGAGASTAVADTIFDNVRIGVPIANPTSATASFPAPGTLAGTTLTFSYTVTDNVGATGTDSMSVTVLPVTERAVIGGVEVPMQIR